MNKINRSHWLQDAKEVIRSRHYTWLPRGLGGAPVEEAMAWIAADIMHICKLSDVPIERVLEAAKTRFEEEEGAQFPQATPTQEIPNILPFSDDVEFTNAYLANDVFDAEIVRGILQADGISCRLEATEVGDMAETEVVVKKRDAEAADKAIADLALYFGEWD